MNYDEIPQSEESMKNSSNKVEPPHYHADVIRPLFFTGAIIMLFSYPLFSKVISGSFIFVLFGIILIILAGLTNRKLKTLFFINALVSLFIVIILEFLATSLTFSDHPYLTLLNQFIALIFLFALYYCLRTLRGFLFK